MKRFKKTPFVHRALRWRWELVKDIPQEECDQLLERLIIYRKWLLKDIFHAGDKSQSVIIILPIEDGQPNYRDAPPT
jgi:hypothetical protein